MQYRRKVLTIFEVTGFLGGIFEIFEVTVGIWLSTLSFYAFKHNIEKEITKADKKHQSTFDELQKLKEDYLAIKKQIKENKKEEEKEKEESESKDFEENKFI